MLNKFLSMKIEIKYRTYQLCTYNSDTEHGVEAIHNSYISFLYNQRIKKIFTH